MFTSNVFPPSFAEEQIESDHIVELSNSSLDIIRFGFCRKYFNKSARMPGSRRLVPLHQTSLRAKSTTVSLSLIVLSSIGSILLLCSRAHQYTRQSLFANYDIIHVAVEKTLFGFYHRPRHYHNYNCMRTAGANKTAKSKYIISDSIKIYKKQSITMPRNHFCRGFYIGGLKHLKTQQLKASTNITLPLMITVNM